MMTGGPVFVVGTPRSGTTLIAKILGRNSALFMSPENQFFEDIYARRRELGDPTNSDVRDRIIEKLRTIYGRYNQVEAQARLDTDWFMAWISRLRESGTSCTRLLDEFQQVQMPPGKRMWGNQTPKDIFHFDEVRANLPSATLFVCVRDVRDFLCSYRGLWRVTPNVSRRSITR